MGRESVEERLERLSRLSESLFGEPEELGFFEAEELLRCAGISREALVDGIYQRLDDQARTYARGGKPVPALLKRALDDLRPLTAPPRKEDDLGRQARAVVRRVLGQIQGLKGTLRARPAPRFQEAYRRKKELSARDKALLGDVARGLQERVEGSRGDS